MRAGHARRYTVLVTRVTAAMRPGWGGARWGGPGWGGAGRGGVGRPMSMVGGGLRLVAGLARIRYLLFTSLLAGGVTLQQVSGHSATRGSVAYNVVGGSLYRATVFDLVIREVRLKQNLSPSPPIFFFLNIDLISGPSTSDHVWRHLLDD